MIRNLIMMTILALIMSGCSTYQEPDYFKEYECYNGKLFKRVHELYSIQVGYHDNMEVPCDDEFIMDYFYDGK